jgi:hypothetical protein
MGFTKSGLAQPHHEMPGPAAKMPGPAFAHFYHRFDHFLYRPHAFEVGEISTGLRLTSRLHHTTSRSLTADLDRYCISGIVVSSCFKRKHPVYRSHVGRSCACMSANALLPAAKAEREILTLPSERSLRYDVARDRSRVIMGLHEPWGGEDLRRLGESIHKTM